MKLMPVSQIAAYLAGFWDHCAGYAVGIPAAPGLTPGEVHLCSCCGGICQETLYLFYFVPGLRTR